MLRQLDQLLLTPENGHFEGSKHHKQSPWMFDDRGYRGEGGLDDFLR